MPDINELVFIDDLPKSQLNSQASTSKPEGIAPYLGRQALAGLEKVPETFLNLNDLLLKAGKFLPITRPISSGVETAQKALGFPNAEEFREGSEKTLGYEPGSFTPQGLFERIAQEAVSTGALTAVTGGLGTAERAEKRKKHKKKRK